MCSVNGEFLVILFFYKFNVKPRGFHACLNKIAWLNKFRGRSF